MRILQVITSLETGGAEKLLVDLIPRLKEQGNEVDLLVFDGSETPFMKMARKRGITVLDLGKGGSVYSPLRLLRLLPYLNRYDIVHTHLTSPQYFAAFGSLLIKVKLVTTEHNTSNRRRKWKMFRYFDRWMYNRYSKVICVSEKTKENLQKHIGKSKAEILTIMNGVEVTDFMRATSTGELEKIAPGSRKIVMVAAFRQEKDQDTAVRALKYLPEQFHLFLVGTGARLVKVKNLVEEEGLVSRVHFMGERMDVPSIMKSADYIVMSSHYEGLSLASVEGMASGRPFIASDVDGLREVVVDQRLLFPEGDASQLAQRVKSIDSKSADYEILGLLCRRLSKKNDVTITSKSYNKLYGQL